jgi:RpiB/LacA/LacB family sugar-phosphate isomerase
MTVFVDFSLFNSNLIKDCSEMRAFVFFILNTLKKGFQMVQGDREPVVVASDHAGFEMKEYVKKYLSEKGIPFYDAGAESLDPQDGYPQFAFKLADLVSSGKYTRGILMCGTGIGASIAANRVKKVRAALCYSADMARMSRLHNNSNVLVLGGRTTTKEVAADIMDAWFASEFEGGRHQGRIDEMDVHC